MCVSTNQKTIMIKKVILFGTLIGALWASASIPAEQDEQVVLNNASDIMNLEHVFSKPQDALLKAATGKGKDKERKKEKKPKKKKESSSNSSGSEDERRRIRREGRPPRVGTPKPVNSTPDQVMRQQEVNVGAAAGGNRHSRHSSREENTVRTGDDGSITIDGPIRRKPLIFPN